ncbi:3-isopropylmalate dehydratase small subunit [Subtercola boreus]|uniref:3-isopropylmalate dehydratase small subunit n=1 Tax=Subtercola boreus TaxID=120213 RepID=A0A3E0VYC2_9MICO|nr:3-isopropylmalate dehydratase small subunit [Subtercola boreus]RFA14595.1 3-isopropylmalate dehydratase small subunit [Subtercola boreus]
MDAFLSHTGIAAPLRRSNVDTDQILPGKYLKRITRTGFEDALFAEWRGDSDFVLNLPPYLGASILVAGPDFGTGSSREHAVWALQDFGFRVVVSPRFGDIFLSNAGKSGLLAALVTAEGSETLWRAVEAEPGLALTVDLEKQTIDAPGVTVPFTIDSYTRWRMMNGLDDIAITLQSNGEIDAFERQRPAYKPSLS